MRIALDDVGVGHSNYQMIIDARPDYFKIDRQFVRASCGDPSRQAVLESVVQLASKLDAYTVAEGVETEEDLETVRRLGVDFVQGHLLGAPLAAEDAVKQLIGDSSNGKSKDDVVRRKHRKTILLVDDSNTSLTLEQTVLAGGPYRIITARNGREGVERALAEQPDLIILDIVMPQMNGFEACRALRSLDVTRSTPVVMVTARHDPATIEAGYRSGCNDFVFKPIFANELIEKVQTWLAD
jgi:CheY-like chemotaxis protein